MMPFVESPLEIQNLIERFDSMRSQTPEHLDLP
jgi:hypothetical protein